MRRPYALGRLSHYFFLLIPMHSLLLLPAKLMDHDKHLREESPEADDRRRVSELACANWGGCSNDVCI